MLHILQIVLNSIVDNAMSLNNKLIDVRVDKIVLFHKIAHNIRSKRLHFDTSSGRELPRLYVGEPEFNYPFKRGSERPMYKMKLQKLVKRLAPIALEQNGAKLVSGTLILAIRRHTHHPRLGTGIKKTTRGRRLVQLITIRVNLLNTRNERVAKQVRMLEKHAQRENNLDIGQILSGIGVFKRTRGGHVIGRGWPNYIRRGKGVGESKTLYLLRCGTCGHVSERIDEKLVD